MKIKLVLFDLDGTLVDSLEDLSDAVNHVRQAFARSPLTAATVSTMVGKGARYLMRQALPELSAVEANQALQLFLEYNAAHIVDKSRLYPGVKELLQQLRDRNITMAVISNKNESLSRQILAALQIDDYFVTIAGGDTFEECKPSPLPLLRVLEQLKISVRESLMIGDSINDIQAGRSAGITTIACSWGYGTPAEINQADWSAHSSADLLEKISVLERG